MYYTNWQRYATHTLIKTNKKLKQNNMEQSNLNVILYSRVSTDEQSESGFSLDYQEESLKRYCNVKGYNIIKSYQEDHSAKNFMRPQWKELQSFVRANKKSVDKILFTRWDRFSRNIENALKVIREFDAMGIDINSAEQYLDKENSDNKMVLSIYLTAGEVERDKISSRTKSGTYQAKREGYYASKAPFDYDSFRDGSKARRGASKGKRSLLKPNKDADFVTQAFKYVAMDIEPIEATRKRLKADGMKLEKSAFNDMLKNIVYAGKIEVPEYKKEPAMLVDAIHEPLIDIATFTKVQDIFGGKRWFGLKPSHKNLEFPLRDFLTCEVCGRQITGSVSKGRSKTYGYYHCRQKCKTRVSVEDAHIKIASLMVNLQINQNVKDFFIEVLKDSEAQINGNKAKQLHDKIESQKGLKKRIEDAEDMLMSKDITPDRFNSIVNRINSELMTVNTEIEILNGGNESIKQYVDTGLELLSNLELMFIESDYDGKRILAGSLFTKKLIFGNTGCRTAEVNEVLDVLTRTNKGCGGSKKGKAIISDSFSAIVPPTTHNLNDILAGTIDLARVWDLYGHLVNEATRRQL
jgi:DNA invertase Pin-like site-specific DNA recombinase